MRLSTVLHSLETGVRHLPLHTVSPHGEGDRVRPDSLWFTSIAQDWPVSFGLGDRTGNSRNRFACDAP